MRHHLAAAASSPGATSAAPADCPAASPAQASRAGILHAVCHVCSLQGHGARGLELLTARCRRCATGAAAELSSAGRALPNPTFLLLCSYQTVPPWCTSTPTSSRACTRPSNTHPSRRRPACTVSSSRTGCRPGQQPGLVVAGCGRRGRDSRPAPAPPDRRCRSPARRPPACRRQERPLRVPRLQARHRGGGAQVWRGRRERALGDLSV